MQRLPLPTKDFERRFEKRHLRPSLSQIAPAEGALRRKTVGGRTPNPSAPRTARPIRRFF
jgi:hypothetical protein